jgi:hypothetical protein
MRFMLLYKPGFEDTAPPASENMEAVGRLIGEMVEAGVLLATDGLLPSSLGARIQIENGGFRVTDGPFAEAKELIGGFAIVRVNAKEDAIAWAKRFLAITGRGESEIRQMHDDPGYDSSLTPC